MQFCAGLAQESVRDLPPSQGSFFRGHIWPHILGEVALPAPETPQCPTGTPTPPGSASRTPGITLLKDITRDRKKQDGNYKMEGSYTVFLHKLTDSD